jgi:hypothetical protein
MEINMLTDSEPSFYPGRKWSISLHVFVVVMSLLAIVIMINYVSHDHFLRLQWSTRAQHELSSRTLSLLQSITNPVKVTLYYDKKDPFYTTVVDLLNEYALANRKISIRTVDYIRDPGAAQNVKTDYKLVLNTEKNVVIFDCNGRVIRMDGDALTRYVTEQIPSEKEFEFRKKPAAFEGETRFTAALLAVTSPAPLTAYFVQGHNEHSPTNSGDLGYHKFVTVLHENCVSVQPFSLVSTNALDCNLLIVAGPSGPFFEAELEKIDKYLAQGGRALFLLNSASINKETGQERSGLDKILAKWGIQLGNQPIHDPDHKVSSDHDMVVRFFNEKHPMVNSLVGSGLHLIKPRAVRKANIASQIADAPRIDELAFTGPRAVTSSTNKPQTFPLVVSVEKGAIHGVITERGVTRLVVVGESVFLCDALIDSAYNRAFAALAIDWLVNRAQLLEGIGPRPVKAYRIVMSHAQWQKAQWLLLAGLPGSVLTLGGLVWLRRRK